MQNLGEFSGTSDVRRDKKNKAKQDYHKQKEFIELLKMQGLQPPSCEFIPDCLTVIKMMNKVYNKDNLPSSLANSKKKKKPKKKTK